jgi:hypothetical protein
MLPKSERDTNQQNMRGAVPAPPRLNAESARPASRLSAARAALRHFLVNELDAREVRITKIIPHDHTAEGWSAEAEILVPNLEVKMLGLPLTQEVLELERYTIELDADLTIKSYEYTEPVVG